MSFLKKYPVPLRELLLAPIIMRASLPALADAPLVSAAGLRDLSEFAGYQDGAFRTAMSRLRASGLVRTHTDAAGIVRYEPLGLTQSLRESVVGRPQRPPGYRLVVFSFTADDGRERQVVREALRLHGFQKLAQNAYIAGQVDTTDLEALFAREGLEDHVFFFTCEDDASPGFQRKLTALFDLAARARLLSRFQDDLEAFLGTRGLSDDEFSRRMLYAGPVHFRVTWVEEPPLPSAVLPPSYPLAHLLTLPQTIAARRARSLPAYFGRVHG
jgi:DNA-binding transcriptional regulator PaaX